MRALFRRVFTFAVLAVAFAGSHPARAWAQTQGSRPLGLSVEPVIATRIESLLATPNLVLVVDYYRIDMRFGPNMRMDAVIVEGVDSPMRLKGIRVQVRDNDNRNRQEGTSYIDIEELATLTRGVSSMADLAAKWAHDDRQATELSLTTNGGFRLAIRQSARVPRAFLSTGLIDPVVTSIELAELPTLKLAFEQALAILNGK